MLTRWIRRPNGALVSAWRTASIAGVIVAVAILAYVRLATSQAFQDDAFSNFLSTLAGIALGVPITVWLTLREATEQGRTLKEQEDAKAKAGREQEEAREKAAQTQANAAAKARRDQVLISIRTELHENKDTLAQRGASGSRQFFVPFFLDEVWAAMSDGGELRWIDDPSVLRQVARAYEYIRLETFLEKQVFEIRHYAGMRIQGSNPDQAIVGYLGHIDVVAMAAIDEALAAIRALVPDEPGASS